MKPITILLSLGLLLTAGALGLVLLAGNRDAVPQAAESRPVPADAPSVATPDPRVAEVLQRLDVLSKEMDDLRADLAVLRSSASREPAHEAAAAAAPAPIDESSASFASEHRNAILKVIEEDREAQKRKAEEEQRARDMAASLARAERTAKQFGLGADQQKALADVYILERQRMEEMRNQMRDQAGMGGDPEAMRNSFREMRDWRLNELTTRLGAELAEKINESDIAAFRGFGGGRDRRNNRDGGPGGDGSNRPGGGF